MPLLPDPIRPSPGGRTPAQVLIEQLSLLDESLRQIAREAFAGDARTLLDSGRFLQQQFAPTPAYELE